MNRKEIKDILVRKLINTDWKKLIILLKNPIIINKDIVSSFMNVDVIYQPYEGSVDISRLKASK